MREDFDSVVADRFQVLDQVPVPDTWSRVRLTEEVLTMIDLETTVPTEPDRKRPTRGVLAGVLAAAAAVAIFFFVAARDRDSVTPSDEPSPIVTTPAPPPEPLFPEVGFQTLRAGTYFVDDVNGSPTPRILVTIGAGWNTFEEWAILNNDLAAGVNFSRPDFLFADACHWGDGYSPAPDTLDRFVAALHEQGGWVDVTSPSDISVDGYAGQAFQRTAPADFSACSSATVGRFRSWRYDSGGLSYYEPGETEKLWILDVNGTITMIVTRMTADAPASTGAELDAVLDSIRIAPG